MTACATAVLLAPTAAAAFAEDASGKSGKFSTFHYPFVRALAVGAGYAPADAERVALLCQATDSGELRGDGLLSPPLRVALDGTGRFTKNSLFFHFARRGAAPAAGATDRPYPGRGDTCALFRGNRAVTPVRAPCGADGPELAALERWAFDAQVRLATPDGRAPALSVDGGQASEVVGGSLDALGILLHALEDSYSHETCMEAAHARLHAPAPRSCAFTWHVTGEYGEGKSATGAARTREAGLATFRTLRAWADAKRPGARAPWDEPTAQRCVDAFVRLADAQARVRFADALARSPADTIACGSR